MLKTYITDYKLNKYVYEKYIKLVMIACEKKRQAFVARFDYLIILSDVSKL